MSTVNITAIEFRQLLDICVNPGHRLFQRAWHEFENRYRTVILGRIRNYLIKWNTSKNVDIVDDISSSVTFRLIHNDFRALKEFREKDNEDKFVNFLSVICRNSAYSYMMDYIKRKHILKENEELNLHRFISERPHIADEIQDYLVHILRRSFSETHKSIYHRERDILIYLLRAVAGFKAREVAQIPVLDISEGNVDTVINRISKLLMNQ
ncbi:MAG: RNA polymerase sigma factor [bacterium]